MMEETVKRKLIGLIRMYQRNAPASLRACCRFSPSCSDYALQALEAFDIGTGLRLTISRLLRCRYPNGGLDELPNFINRNQGEHK